MPSAKSGPVRTALTGSLECAAAYAAVSNIIILVHLALEAPVGNTLRYALWSQLLLLAAIALGALAFAVAHVIFVRAEVAVVSRFTGKLVASSGAISLCVAVMALAWATGQGALAACAVLAMPLVIIPALRPGPYAGSPLAAHRSCLKIALLLVVVPFLAVSRPNRNWGPLEAASAALAIAGLIAVATLYRSRTERAWISLTASRWLLALASAIGLFGGQFLEADPARGIGDSAIGPAPGARPDIVLIVLDTVRADHTSVYGYGRDTTPVLRALWQSGGTRYERAIAAADWTLPSMASLMTGLHVPHHQALARGTREPSPIAPTEPMLAETLHRHGYGTSGIVANEILDPLFGFDRGFDDFRVRRGNRMPYWPFLLGCELMDRWGPRTLLKGTRSAAEITGDAIRVLQEVRRGRARPMFLFLNYMDAHAPYIPPDEWAEKFGTPRSRTRPSHYARQQADVMKGLQSVRPEDRDRMVADYDASIAYLDNSLGTLFGALREAGLFTTSLIIVTADHGEMFGESDIVGHRAGTFLELIHVPLLVKYPGQTKAQTVLDVASVVDIFPTVLAAAGLAVERPLDGRDLRAPRESAERIAFSASFEPVWAEGNARFRGEEWAAVTGPAVYRIMRDGAKTATPWPGGDGTGSPVPPLRTSSDVFRNLQALAEESSQVTPARHPDLMNRLRSLGYLGR